MRTSRFIAAALTLCMACATPGLRGPSAANTTATGNSSANSGNSSANSGNSSANSGNSSANSGNASRGSGQSSGQSAASSQNSNNSSANSSQSSQNSRGSSDSSAASNQSSANADAQRSSWVVAGAALLLSTAGAVGLIISSVRRSDMQPGPDKLQDQAQPAQAWLKANLRQLKQDLALGAGPALDDLAAAAEIRLEHRERFCRLLARHRQELLAPLRSGDVSIAATIEALTRVGELTRSDDVLRADAEALMRRHSDPG